MTTLGPKGQTVLVTGGAGFIGSHLVDALAADNDVRVLDDFSSGTPAYLPSDVAIFEGDICDPTVLARAMEGVDLVFHEAAIVDVGRSVADPVTTHAVNCSATLSLLEAARAADARAVLASSAAIYGHPVRVPVAEADTTDPTSPYGLQKLALDRYAHLYNDLYGLETVALRYFNVYGPRGVGGAYSGVIDIFLQQARDGGPVTVTGDGTQTRDFVHVDDVVQANLLAATSDYVGEAYNVGTGESVTIQRLAELICDLTGSDADVVNVEARPGDIQHSRADVEKARLHLGYEPTVTLSEGLGRLVGVTV